MQPRVTAILVARNGAAFLGRTLPALATQTRRADTTVFVDAGSADATQALLAAAGPTQLVTASAKHGSFGSAVAKAVRVALPQASPDEWLWLLAHDSAPHPRALASLLGAVEIAPSVAVAGPKLVRWDQPDTIAEYGETMTTLGASIALVENELDQAQHDRQSDLLAVAGSGMLVRRSVWSELGGFDPGLPTVDASLDFCVRARLAGHRVVGVPTARVSTAGGPESFGRARVSAMARARIVRAAQLHRRLVYAPAILLPLHWLGLLPLALLRSIGDLARKQPGSIPGEFAAAVGTAFSPGVAPARRNLRRTRKVGWSAITPLRMTIGQAQEHRAQQRETVRTAAAARRRVGFLTGGGGWMVLLLAAIGAIVFGPLLGASAVTGGGLVPLGSDLGAIWSNAIWGVDGVGGITSPADPFIVVLAVLATLTFWSPSLSIALLYAVALPLAALGAWWCAVRFSERSWPPAIAAVLWALAPPFLTSLMGGHLGAVIAHLLLPWLVLAAVTAARSWSAAAAAALLLAAVTASAPVLIPALILALVARMIARPTRVHRMIGIVIPGALLFAPLVYANIARGTPLAWLAEPGIPVIGELASGWQLAVGSAVPAIAGWAEWGFGALVPVLLLAPLGALALLALFVPGSRRSYPALGLALLGYLTAVLATRLELGIVGSQPVAIWPGAALSLYWLGLVGAVAVSLEAVRRYSAAPALAVALASALAVAPLLAAPLTGTAPVRASSGLLLPAFVAAEAGANPSMGTLQFDPQQDGGLAVTVHRGPGTTMDETSTFAATSTAPSAQELELAVLAANLASRSGMDTTTQLRERSIAFILLADAGGAGDNDAAEIRSRAEAAFDANSNLAPIGNTAQGLLWHFKDPDAAAPLVRAEPAPFALAIAVTQGIVLVLALLFAVPTSRGRGRSSIAAPNDPIALAEEEDDE